MNRELYDLILEENQRLKRAIKARNRRKATQLLNRIIYGKKRGK